MRGRRDPVRFRVRVAVLRKGEGRNALNEPVGAWLRAGEAYAAREDQRDSEAVAAGRDLAILSARFVFRSTVLSRSITPADRLAIGGAFDDSGSLLSGAVWSVDGVKERGGTDGAEIEVSALFNRADQP